MVSVRSHRVLVRKSQKKCTGAIAFIAHESQGVALETDQRN